MDWLKAIFDFCVRNWRIIALVLVDLVVLLVTIFKKRTKVKLDGFEDVLMELPTLISKAEDIYGPKTGQEKFIYVYTAAMDLLLKKFGADVVKENNLGVVVQQSIEKILSTPTKKER